MAPPAKTYTTLIADMTTYFERGEVSDVSVYAQLPRLSMMGQLRLAKEAKTLISRVSLTSTMTIGNPIIDKPARWRNTESFNFGSGVALSTRTPLYIRSYEWCRLYWPDPAETDVPMYYSDYDYQHWLVAPTPDRAYPFEVMIQEEIEPVSDVVATNLYTEYAYDVLLHACLLEGWLYLKDPAKIQMEQTYYDRLLQGITFEQDLRKTDKTEKGAAA